MLQRSSLAALAVFVFAPALRAQSCGTGQFFLKNDVLPANPGLAAASVIQGLCDGEAAGCVFNVSAIAPTVKVKLAAIGYLDAFGNNGAQALVNLQIYDGITFPGGIPQLGTLVFDYVATTQASIAVQTHAINTVDLSQFDIPVSSGKLVVVWWMDQNFGAGSCQQGYQDNFATDYNGSGSGGCNVHEKNLIYILGQGWRDAATATVSGFPLCPIYYAGNWLIRACVEQGGPATPYCYGDGTLATACPCGNTGGPGAGCENSAATGGAILGFSGTANPDTLVLTSSGELPTVSSIFLQGSSDIPGGVPFGDGLRCAGGSLKRLFLKSASGGIASAPNFGAGDPSITTQSANLGDPISPGMIRYYQVYYRDPAAFFCPAPTGNTWNVSGGMKVVW